MSQNWLFYTTLVNSPSRSAPTDSAEEAYVYGFSGHTPRLNVEHDPEKRVFRITGADGKVSVFRDEPVRFLVATRDPRTGETMPALRYGEPEYLYLCREERERA
jgi:hypothetical protein